MKTQKELKEFVKNGFQTENDIIEFINVYLLTKWDQQRMEEINISLSDILNKRYFSFQENEIKEITDKWNRILGTTFFL